jgi:integrase
MGKRSRELGALEVSRLKSEGFHFVGTVAGLALNVTGTGARSWVLRYSIAGKRRDMGLGSYPEVTLAKAHEKAREAKEKIRVGIDPLYEKKALRSAMLAAQVKEITFRDAAGQYIEAKRSEWKNSKHAAQWESTLEQYAYPVIGKLHVKDVALPHILKILEPIWKSKTETASRLRGRIENVLDWAAVHKYREGENPAKWKGHLDKILPMPSKISKVEHHDALPYSEIGSFMAELQKREGYGARCLEFAILTAARSGEARGAKWDEIDLDKAIWTIPAGRMKAGKEHRVPLSKAALDLLEAIPRTESEFVFPSSKGAMLSDMTLSALLKRMDVDAVPHGFRSTFRDWAAEQTAYPREVAEQSLAHGLKDKVEAAYQRGDLFEKRKRLMADWAKYCNSPSAKSAEVFPIRQEA